MEVSIDMKRTLRDERVKLVERKEWCIEEKDEKYWGGSLTNFHILVSSSKFYLIGP